MEKIWEIKERGGSLNANDACFLLRFIQEHTAPLFSLRASCISESTRTGGNNKYAAAGQQHKPAGSTTDSCNNTGKHHSLQKSDRDWKKRPPRNTHQGADRLVSGPASGLDISNLDQFPPMPLSMQEKRLA